MTTSNKTTFLNQFHMLNISALLYNQIKNRTYIMTLNQTGINPYEI